MVSRRYQTRWSGAIRTVNYSILLISQQYNVKVYLYFIMASSYKVHILHCILLWFSQLHEAVT